MARTPSKPRDSQKGTAKPRTPRAKQGDPAPKDPTRATVDRGSGGAKAVGAVGAVGVGRGALPNSASRARRPGFLHATSAIAPLAQIERLRTFRPGLPSGDSIASEVERFARELAKHEHAAGGLARAWSSLAPQPLQCVTRVERLHAGVLTIIASDASARYDAEMWLAEGGLAALRGVAARTLRRVKVTIG